MFFWSKQKHIRDIEPLFALKLQDVEATAAYASPYNQASGGAGLPPSPKNEEEKVEREQPAPSVATETPQPSSEERTITEGRTLAERPEPEQDNDYEAYWICKSCGGANAAYIHRCDTCALACEREPTTDQQPLSPDDWICQECESKNSLPAYICRSTRLTLSYI